MKVSLPVLSGFGGGGGCFPANSFIETPKGNVLAGSLNVGDMVHAFDDKGIIHEKRITHRFEHDSEDVYCYHIWGAGSLRLTPNHWVQNQYGTFAEISTLQNIQDMVVDARGHLRPIMKVKYLGVMKVINFHVEDLGTLIIDGIRCHNGGIDHSLRGRGGGGSSGKGGGGGSGPSFREDPDTLQANTKIALLEAICCGPIEGLVNGEKSILIDYTPLTNESGDRNFNGMSWYFRNGDLDQDIIPGFETIEQPVPVNVRMYYNTPVVRQVNAPGAYGLVVTVSIPRLGEQKASENALVGNAVTFDIKISSQGGPARSYSKDITGKTTSQYMRSYFFQVHDDGPWDISLTRTKEDATSALIYDETYFEAYSVQYADKLTYPGVALLGYLADAQEFGSSLPSRFARIKGLIVDVPSNYNPSTRTFTGFWDGTWKQAWSDNPAFFLWWILTDLDNGLGEYIKNYSLEMTEADIYELAQYCDTMVDDGKGGKEPMFTFNAWMTTREKALDALRLICGSFRTQIFWGHGMVAFSQDKPRTPSRLFTNANVVDGTFDYSESAYSSRYSVFLISWHNPEDYHRETIEVYEDPELVQKYGYKTTSVSLIGCTSRGQARRAGAYLAYTQELEAWTVLFSVGIAEFSTLPGEIIAISDRDYSGVSYGGRLKSKQNLQLVLDRKVNFSDNNTYKISVVLQDGTLETVEITNPNSETDTITLQTNFSKEPINGAIWVLYSTSLVPQTYRIMGVTEDSPLQFSILAAKHDERKFEAINTGYLLPDPPTSLIPTGEVPPPTNITHLEYFAISGNSIAPAMTISWQPPNPMDGRIAYYEIWIQGPTEGNLYWRNLGMTSGVSMELVGTEVGVYNIQVRSITNIALRSIWTSQTINVLAASQKLPDVTGFEAVISSPSGVALSWDDVHILGLQGYIVSFNEKQYSTTTKNLLISDLTGKIGEIFFEIYVTNSLGSLSDKTNTSVTILPPTSPTPEVVAKTDGLYLTWQDCKTTWPIRHYEVTDSYTGKKSIAYTEEFNISVRASDTYNFTVTAVDIYDNTSDSEFTYFVQPPPDVQNFSAFIKSPDGVLLSWKAIDLIELSSYVISNGVNAEVKGTSLLVKDLSRTTGTITYEIKAKNVAGLLSETPAISSVLISAPEVPTPELLIKTDGLWVAWQNCKTTWPIRHYELEDLGKQHILYNEEIRLSVREAGNYSMDVTAVDIYDNRSRVVFEYEIKPPDAPTNFMAVIQSPDSVLLTWDAVSAPDLSSYVITNGTDAEVKGTSLLIKDLSGKIGHIVYEIKCKTVTGLLSEEPALATIDIEAPNNPTATVVITTDGLRLTWNDCRSTWPIRHYEVTDSYTGREHILYDEQLDVTPRPFGEYTFTVTAIDIYDNQSETVENSVEISGIGNPVLRLHVEGGVIRVMWEPVASPFPLSHYEIAGIDEIIIQETKSTYYDVPPNRLNHTGLVELKARAVDTVGNKSEFGSLSEVIPPPSPPVVNVRISDDKRQVEVSWVEPPSPMPVLYYDVVRVYSIDSISYEDDSYGRFDTTMISTVPLTADVDNAQHEFRVRAVNSLGQTSSWGFNDVQILKPTVITHLVDEVVDNYVKFSWLKPVVTSFAIKTYLIERVEEGYPIYLGEVDAEFFIQFYPQKGYYAHSVTAIDWAGNKSPAVSKTSFVDEPPDFQVFDDYDSLFNGTKTNMYLDGQGGMYGPVLDETWEENYNRIGGSDVTWQDKVNAGYDSWQAPHVGTGIYQEVVDVGIDISSTTIVVTPTIEILSESAKVTCKIETSLDGEIWNVVAENAYQVYAINFRYVRYTFTVTNGIALFKDIKYVLKVKKKTDSGTVQYLAIYGQEGLWVPFGTDFVDVKGQPIVQVVGNKPSGGNYPYFVYTDFEDVRSPTGFKVFVVDKYGNYIDAEVTWQANGV